MPKIPDSKNDLKESLTNLKSSIDNLNKAIEPHMEKKDWGKNLLFEKKLAVHKNLIELINEQNKLSDGIIALLEIIKRNKPVKKRLPIPPPPRPNPVHFIRVPVKKEGKKKGRV